MDKKNIDNLKAILKGGQVEKNIQVGYSPAKESGVGSKGKKPGDVWEHNGKRWTMSENGTVSNITMFDDVRMPMFCPSCNSIMRGKGDTKAYNINGTCLDCMVTQHDELRKEGKLEQFAWRKRLRSSQSWLKEQYQQLDEFKSVKKKNPEFVMSDGTIERWESNLDMDKAISEYEEYLDTYSKELTQAIGQYEEKYGIALDEKV